MEDKNNWVSRLDRLCELVQSCKISSDKKEFRDYCFLTPVDSLMIYCPYKEKEVHRIPYKLFSGEICGDTLAMKCNKKQTYKE